MAPNIIESNLENVSVIVLTIATIHQSLQINSYSSSMRITFYWVSSQYLNVAIAVNSDKEEMDAVNIFLPLKTQSSCQILGEMVRWNV